MVLKSNNNTTGSGDDVGPGTTDHDRQLPVPQQQQPLSSPPASCSLSPTQIDDLLHVMAPASTATAGLAATEVLPSKLHGRDVFIPLNAIAFYAGTLTPETVTTTTATTTTADPNTTNTTTTGIITQNEKEEEIVYVHPTHNGTTTKTTKQKSNFNKNIQGMHRMTVSDTMDWLTRHSSSASSSLASSKSATTATATGTEINKKGKTIATTKKKKTITTNSTTTTRAAAATSTSSVPVTKLATPVLPRVFNITEEYNAAGHCVVSEALDLSSRIEQIYGNNDPRVDEKGEGGGKINSTTATVKDSNETITPLPLSPKKKKQLSDAEYTRITQRLEELELLESENEQQQQQQQQQHSRNSKQKASSSGFGFKKGFLTKNTSRTTKKKQKKKTPTRTTSNPTSKISHNRNVLAWEQAQSHQPPPSPPNLGTAIAAAPPAAGAAERSNKTSAMTTHHTTSRTTTTPALKRTGVTIDTTQNQILEIPREGRQQPVPKKMTIKNPSGITSTSSTNTPSPAFTDTGTRMLDASVFTGKILERGTNTTTTTTPTPTTTIHNPQQQVSHQQQYPLPPPRQNQRVSRFKQQFQQEQQHSNPTRSQNPDDSTTTIVPPPANTTTTASTTTTSTTRISSHSHSKASSRPSMPPMVVPKKKRVSRFKQERQQY